MHYELYKFSVFQHIGLLGDFSHLCRVSRHDDGRMQLSIHLLEKRGNHLCISSIQLSCGFVCQQEGWLVDEGTANGDTGLFTPQKDASQGYLSTMQCPQIPAVPRHAVLPPPSKLILWQGLAKGCSATL